MKLKVRCPSCAKLYEVESDEILNETPIFQCISCESRFGFEYSSEEQTVSNPISAFLLQTPIQKEIAAQQQEVSQKQAAQAELKACPKCSALNERKSSECYSCHVIFARLEGLPEDASLRAQPSLVRKWKNILENFDNEELHNQFIRDCHELEALRFAMMKYEEIKNAQGGDLLCDQMIAKINSLMLVGLAQKPVAKIAEKNSHPKWQKYMYWGPYALCALLILWGMLSLGHRNLIGVGVALACMTSGLIVMIRGKISLSDFID